MPDTQGKRKTHEAQIVRLTKGKHRKTFLDSQQELSLAALVVDAEEQKSLKKTERIKTIKATKHGHGRPSSKTKSRLEERKEALIAQVTRAKRNRTKSRKSQLNGSTQISSECQDKKQVRKSVSFA